MNKIKGKQIESVDLDQVLMESDLVVTSAVGAITSADFDSGKTYKTISRFKADGIFNPDTAEQFRREILSRGGTEHPAVLFRNFMGREPDNPALLRRMGPAH